MKARAIIIYFGTTTKETNSLGSLNQKERNGSLSRPFGPIPTFEAAHSLKNVQNLEHTVQKRRLYPFLVFSPPPEGAEGKAVDFQKNAMCSQLEPSDGKCALPSLPGELIILWMDGILHHFETI